MTEVDHTKNITKYVGGWFNDQETSDIEVQLKDKVLHCHRMVLQSWSTVWAVALKDKAESALDLTAHDEATAEMCVKYCYTGTMTLTDDNLTKVHYFACQYNLEELQSSCEEVMTDDITDTNCMAIYHYLSAHEFPSLERARELTNDYVCEEFVPASKSDGFLQISLETLCDLLREDTLNANEDEVLDACCRWLGDNPDPQAKERVLKHVRFPMLSAKRLIEFKSHKLFHPDMEARHSFAMQWALTEQLDDNDVEPIRNKLTEVNNQNEILTPRILPLYYQSQLLDFDAASVLSSMLGGTRVARPLLDSSQGTDSMTFDKAVKGQGPFVCIIKSKSGHLFGAYVEDNLMEGEGGGGRRGGGAGWIAGSPNNFLFSLKNIYPQRVVKLRRSSKGNGVNVAGGGLRVGDAGGLIAFSNHSTADDPAFELAPGYEPVGSKTLHGKFGSYTPKMMEVFGLSLPSRKRQREENKTR